MQVYYFTGFQHAISNLAFRRIKVARFNDLNDPFELLAADLSDKQFRRLMIEEKKRINDKLGLICFCTSWENPLLWGHYAEKHTGMALGFDIPDTQLYKIIYSSQLKKIIPISGKYPISERVKIELLTTKFKDWEYEDERRMIVELSKCNEEKPFFFVPFSDSLTLNQVILGPKCEVSCLTLKRLIELHPIIDIVKSRIAFQTFSVVVNKVATRKIRKDLGLMKT